MTELHNEAYPIAKDKNYLFDLDHLSVINVIGDKAREFLQGQVTCDVNAVHALQMRPAALCNLKGRILALMDIIDWDGIKLFTAKTLAHETINTLSKPALFSKVRLELNSDLKLYGFKHQNAQDVVPEGFKAMNNAYEAFADIYLHYHLGNGFYILAVKESDSERITAPFVQSAQFADSKSWHAQMLNMLQVQIYPETRGLFLPQRLELDKTECISFTKGCYKGQEIIARMHYKSKSKHQLRCYRIQTEATLRAGERLLTPDTLSEYGEIIDYTQYGIHDYLVCVSHLIEPPMPSVLVLSEGNVEVALETI